jgi:hypothetical protein
MESLVQIQSLAPNFKIYMNVTESLEDIAEKYRTRIKNIDNNAIRKWCKTYGILLK